jgi:FixJ family two-component response regulator
MAGRTGQVFIVDDDHSVRKALRRLLTASGYLVSAFASGREFLEQVQANGAGVLILDLRMPEMDGFALQRRLLDLASPLKVILVTGLILPGDCERSMSQGAVGLLVKPFDDVALLDLVERALAA